MTKTAQEHMTDMTAETSLNEFFLRNPKDITDADLSRLVARARDDRALFIAKGETTRREKDDE